jgi:photosystem II stability/assembly factor-like uncharacterized protein
MIFQRQGFWLSIIAIGLGTIPLLNEAGASPESPLLVNQIAIDPANSRIVYAATRPQGIIKSTDGGSTWHPARLGLTNTSVYEIVIDPKRPKVLYLGTFGGGIFKSEDAGGRWREANQGLGNTNIHALTINPSNTNQLVVSTSTGDLFRTADGGDSWMPFNEGLPVFQGDVIATLLFHPDGPNDLYLAQSRLYRTLDNFSAWRPIEGELPDDDSITAVAFHPSGRWLYAGTMKHGLFRADLGVPTDSANARISWMPATGPFVSKWIRLIVFDLRLPTEVYIGVEGGGLYKSNDDGQSWKEINNGLPTMDVESLAIDPKDRKHLYVGTHGSGVFISEDGGMSWTPPAMVVVEPPQALIASLSGQPRSTPLPKRPVAVPPAFTKCNKCHGWTDPLLNQKQTYWRVSPNRRNWGPTVRRMSAGAGLTPAEQDEIVRFLTEYSHSE